MAIDYDVSKGLSGGFSGASAGAGIGGPWGAAIGGAVGLGAGFFGGDDEDENDPRQKAMQRHRDVINMLEGRYETRKNQSPTETPLYQAGMSQAQERVRQEAGRDASQAAARGLTGSQFEVAQDQNRSQQLGSFQQNLLQNSVRADRKRERQALQQLLGAHGDLSQFQFQAAQAQDKREMAQNKNAQSSLMGLGSTLGGMEGGPPLEDTLNNFFGGGGGAPAGGPAFSPGPMSA